LYCHYCSVMHVTVMPVSAYMALAFVFGFIPNKLMMMKYACFRFPTEPSNCGRRAANEGRTLFIANQSHLSSPRLTSPERKTAVPSSDRDRIFKLMLNLRH